MSKSATDGYGEGGYGEGVYGTHDPELSLSGQSDSVSGSSGLLSVPKLGIGNEVLGNEYTLILEERTGGAYGSDDTQRTIALHSDNFTKGPTWDKEASVPSKWSVATAYDESLEDWALQNAYLYYAGELFLHGRCYSVESNDRAGTTTLEGRGYIEELKRIGEDDTSDAFGETFVYENIPYTDAIQEQWGLTDIDATVYEVEPETVDENQEVQTALNQPQFENVTTAARERNQPWQFSENKWIWIRPNCWPMKATHATFRSSLKHDFASSEIYTGGSSIILSKGGQETNWPHYAEWEFEVAYTLPSVFFGCKVRDTYSTDNGTPEFEWYLIHPNGQEYSLNLNREIGMKEMKALDRWTEVGHESTNDFDENSYRGPDLDPGTYRLGCRVTNSMENENDNTPYRYYVDVVAPYDARYIPPNDPRWNDEWVDLHEDGGYLNGPPISGEVTIEFDEFEAGYNVTEGAFQVNMLDSDSGVVQLQLSNDGGKNWYPKGPSSKNVERVRTKFTETYGTTLKARIRLGPMSPDGARTRTPRYNYATEVFGNFRMYAWTNTREVIDTEELRGSRYENLKTLHDNSNMVFVADHTAPDNPTAESFVPGSVERDADSLQPLTYKRDLDLSDYANILRIFGFRESSDDPISFTWYNSGEIQKRGEVWAQPVFTQKEGIGTLRQLGRPLLREKVAQDNLVGSMTTMPVDIDPGYGYRLDSFDNELVTLYRVKSSAGENPSCELEFHPPRSLVRDLRDLSQDVRTFKK